MQLSMVVNYHKALADPTRIKMLILLGSGELNGQALAERLAVTPATITHHAAKLRVACLINERRDKNTIYFKLNREFLNKMAGAAARLIDRSSEGGTRVLDEQQLRMQESVLNNFFDAEGRLKSIPAQLKKKLIVLEHLASKLDIGRTYAEKELNDFIKTFHEDFATIRREFIMHQFMFRDNQIYEVNPPELWTRWERLS